MADGEDQPDEQQSAPVVLTPPAGQDAIVGESRIEPQTEATKADAGTKMFVMFFFLLVPPLGIVLLAAVVWSLYKQFMAT